MIKYIEGSNIIHSKAIALVNPVNCVGVMGAGLAKEFKNNFPSYYKAYKDACKANLIQPGRMHIYPLNGIHNQYIISFPTKTHWTNKSSMGYIEEGLIALRHTIEYHHIASVALPKIGCGLGGLNWKNVRSAIEDHLKDSSATILVYV